MNPEFARNLWLEATRRRLLGLLAVLALVYGATAFLDHATVDAMITSLGVVGLVIFGVCGGVWASRAAGAAVLDEIRGRTWEFQRLSALTPWAMTWGKLLGAGALAWIGALIGMAAVVVHAAKQKDIGQALIMAAGLIALGLFLQGCAMAAALVGVRKARGEGRIATGGAVLLGVLAGVVLLWIVSGHLPPQLSAVTGQSVDVLSQDVVAFWDFTAPGPLFVSLSMAAFAAWAVVAAWRLMRLELQMRNTPWVWIGFLVFAGLWRAGLTPAMAGASGRALTAAMVFGLLTYGAAFVEPIDALRLRRAAGALARGRPLEMASLAPAQIWPLKLAFICVIIAVLAPHSIFGGVVQPVTPFTVLIFLIRDLGVIALFRYGSRPVRGDLSSVIVIALLYGVGAVFDHVIGSEGFALFSPFSQSAPVVTLISGLIQAGVAWLIAARRIGGAGPSAASNIRG